MADQTGQVKSEKLRVKSEIPEEWKMTTLGQQIKVGRGSSPLPIQDFLSNNGIPWVKIADASASESRYIEKTREFIKEEGRSTSVKIGDLIVSNSATPGIPKFMKIDACVHDGWLVFSEYKELDKLFLYYFFLDYRRTLEHSASGTVFVNLQTEIVRSIELNLAPLPEQRAIASVLSSLDDKIELLREQNKTLEATAQAIFKEWFVKFNFPVEFGVNSGKLKRKNIGYKDAGGKMIDSELGQIPEGWRVGTVNDFIKRETISYRCDQDDLLSKGKTPIIDQGTSGLYGYTEREPDFQASKENPVILFTNHTCNMWFVNYSFCAIQNVIPFRGNDKYDIFFVYYMTLGRVSFIEYKGHWPDFEQKEYIIPTPKIANEFAEFVKPLQYKIWNNISQIQTLSTLRDTLLPKLMRGEVRVEGFNN